MAFKMAGFSPFTKSPMKQAEDPKKKPPPKVGETRSEYMSRTIGNPGYFNDTRTWDGTKWVGDKPGTPKKKE